jgi:hypothetical protein
MPPSSQSHDDEIEDSDVVDGSPSDWHALRVPEILTYNPQPAQLEVAVPERTMPP